MRVRHLLEMQRFRITVLFTLLLLPDLAPAWRAGEVDTVAIVKEWATTLGDELWGLSESLTKSDQIRIKYKQMNASVKKKDGKQILESSLRSVSTMLTRKINAVKCIHATAERLAREFNYTMIKNTSYEFEYCSAKYSSFYYLDRPDKDNVTIRDDTPEFAKNNSNYMKVTLERDSHFYDISVNTNISCIHVPTNIFYRENEALNAILWSKDLNEIFTKNYQSDPSLVWQYFGSSRGVLRFYPGMPWNMQETDTYDCRVKSWYIEAATCSKDVVILFDVSGSMTGFKNYVARMTLQSILATLSNNDFVNVYTFKANTTEVVACFKGFVQATPENLLTIRSLLEPMKDGKHRVPLEGNANLTKAYITAFTTLKERRKDCNVSSSQGCNQLVMVITDYVPGNLTEVFEEYNREVVGGKTYIPVRVFTYLIGKEVTNVREIQWMACLNRGYFVHIHSVEEVQQQVLKYINVIARPMILEGRMPPPTWTHAIRDDTRTGKWDVSGDVNKPDEDKLVTSVAIPAFDYRYNVENDDDAILLGVAGTDVPIDSIAKLAQPHQLGVNGYSFIVSNNGYLLLHPLLITTINNKLQENYNSVDFVEVEQVDDGKGPRELGEKIKALRESLVNGDEGNMTDVEVLYHYDHMRRISRVKHDYFFNKLVGTPFSMGISLPMGYGDTELMLKDNPLEAKQGQDLTGINVTTYFNYTYRVHPDWVYCKYHYLEGHESENAEIEIFKFLVNLSRNKIDITKKQYAEDAHSDTTFIFEKHCGNTTTKAKDDYYCNEDLVKQLVFDAKLSAPYFRNWDASPEERELAKKYNVDVRFIATSSGLTRWHYIFDDSKNEKVNPNGYREKEYDKKVFGDIYYNAIEETWYKAAVLQHMISPEALVIATPLRILDDTIQNRPNIENDDGDITITASYAIFYKDGKSETPAAVVGFQYQYSNFRDIFFNMTNRNSAISCGGDSKYNCYLIDSSGYIVVGMEKSEVGKFFGVLYPGILQSFIDMKVFDHVEVFNYQALCPLSTIKEKSNAWSLTTPFSIATNFMRWLFAEALLLLFSFSDSYRYTYAAPIDDVSDYLDNQYPESTTMPPNGADNETIEAKEAEDDTPFSCDHRITLYILNQLYFLNSMGVTPVVQKDEPGDCHQPYWASLVSKTNLLLLVVEKGDWDFLPDCKKPPDTKPQPTSDSTTSREPCHKLDLGRLTRRRLEDCYTYHDKERNITACGMGSLNQVNIIAFVIMCMVASLASVLFA
ncbi:voltage-dependent calcium channel subunit alpha-2/delta-4 [Epargyreus clarus]|uniref:voltage-dependent calcium channel subunit alpha-2/delta-4 n=1 Tax=Epargyreus clarus TaxID=520877 RepID=UPI003C2DF5EB